jgi:hypothetical protein
MVHKLNDTVKKQPDPYKSYTSLCGPVTLKSQCKRGKIQDRKNRLNELNRNSLYKIKFISVFEKTAKKETWGSMDKR